MKVVFLPLCLLILSGHALAAERTAKFSVPDMTCALCPVTVETAMGHVAGVKSVNAAFDSKSAIVVFEDSDTSPEQIAEASANAGYPAILEGVE